jgi:glycosyltransferase involved in cell wall biosynthesis
MSPPSISCIVPAYQAARYIAAALDSIFAQTLSPFEVIVVDDGSTDATPQLLDRYGDRIRRLRRANAGPAAARNDGIRAARGEWLAFLDADDLWHPEKLARQTAFLAARPDLDCCLTWKRQFWEDCVRADEERLRREQHPITTDAPGYVLQTLLVGRTDFLRIGLLDERLRVGEDTDWLARAEDLGLRRGVIPEVLVYRRMHEYNLSYEGHSPRGVDDRLAIVAARMKRRREGATSAPATPTPHRVP